MAGLGGCADRTVQTACPPGAGRASAIYTLYLGEAIAGRNDLTDAEWRTFVDTVVRANLPEGYTVFDANGGWFNAKTGKSVRERTKVLLAVLPEGPDGLAAINRVRAAYQNQFQQQLVGMTVERGGGDF